MNDHITVIGAGLAGSEAAYQLAEMGIPVTLVEMRPQKQTPAHHTPYFAELVCSNSLRAAALTNAVGLLKEEMRRLHSVIMKAADSHQVPAGGALAVDRMGYAREVTRLVKDHPLVTFVEKEVTAIPREGIVIIATGPLTEGALAEDIENFCGGEGFHFYDAAAPIVTKDSLDMDVVYRMSRYNKGEAAYLNCPMNEEEYKAFREALCQAEMAPVHGFENKKVFEGCMPIEVMAARGEDTMRFGPMKPVGLPDPRTGRDPYAVVQLRQDNEDDTMYNLVGFQTHLKWGEQKRVFSMIPGLAGAEFVRYGVMHRNTFLNSPKLLSRSFKLLKGENLWFAGQMTGVEGYMESAMSGLLAGHALAREMLGLIPFDLPHDTMTGALSDHVCDRSVPDFQPMGSNMGILPPLPERVKDKKKRYTQVAERAIAALREELVRADYTIHFAESEEAIRRGMEEGEAQ